MAPYPPSASSLKSASIAVVAALLVVGAGCASSDPDPDASSSAASASSRKADAAFTPATLQSLQSLRDTDLRLVRFEAGGKRVAVPAGTPVSLRFGEPGRIAGRAPVNRYFGSYQLGPEGVVTWPNAALGATRMAGPEEAMALEQQFMQVLTSTSRLVTSPEGARFLNDDGSDVLEFRRSAGD